MADTRAFPLSPTTKRSLGGLGVDAPEEQLAERFHRWRTKIPYRPFRVYHLQLIVFLGLQVFEWLLQGSLVITLWKTPDDDDDDNTDDDDKKDDDDDRVRHRNTAAAFVTFMFAPWVIVALVLTLYGKQSPALPPPEQRVRRLLFFPFILAFNVLWYGFTDVYVTFTRFGIESMRYLYNLFVDQCCRPANMERLERESSIPPYRMRSYIFFRGFYQFLFGSVPISLALLFVMFMSFHEYIESLVGSCFAVTVISLFANLYKIIRFRKETKIRMYLPAMYSMTSFRRKGAWEKQRLSGSVTVSCDIDEFPWVDFYNDVYMSVTLRPVSNESLLYFKNACRLLARSWQLQHFIAANCQIADDGPLSVQYITEPMRKNHGLKLLDLSHNIMNNRGCVPLSELIGHTTTLTALDISHNRIGEEGFSFLSNAMKVNVTLKMLDVSHNRLAPGSAVDVGNFLRLNFNLVDLRLNKCRFDDESMKGMAKGLSANRVLKKLWMRYNDIGPVGMGYLSQALAENNKLNQLALEGNHIGDEGVRLLCEIIPHNESISSIELVANQIGDVGAKALGNAIWRNNILQYVYLSSNNIGPVGARAIATGLAQARELRHLSLVKNRIGDAGAISIAEALRRNSRLSELHLGSNRIGDEGVTAIADALRTNTMLETLSLEDNPFGEEGAGHFCDSLRQHDTLKTLLIDGHCLSEAMVQNLRGLGVVGRNFRVSIRQRVASQGEQEQIDSIMENSRAQITPPIETTSVVEDDKVDIPVIPSQFQTELRTTMLAMENVVLGMETMDDLDIAPGAVNRSGEP